MKNILLDMDWTFYGFDNWKYEWSLLQKEVNKKVLELIKNREPWLNKEEIFRNITLRYWENFSIAFEELYKISKQDYFNFTWNIDPNWKIIVYENLIEIFKKIKTQEKKIFIVSDAPKIWINKIVQFFNVWDLLDWIYSGEWDLRKSNWKLYEKVIWDWIEPEKSIMVWDQEISDIINAKKLWFPTIYLNRNWKKSDYSDYNVDSLNKILLYI